VYIKKIHQLTYSAVDGFSLRLETSVRF